MLNHFLCVHGFSSVDTSKTSNSSDPASVRFQSHFFSKFFLPTPEQAYHTYDTLYSRERAGTSYRYLSCIGSGSFVPTFLQLRLASRRQQVEVYSGSRTLHYDFTASTNSTSTQWETVSDCPSFPCLWAPIVSSSQIRDGVAVDESAELLHAMLGRLVRRHVLRGVLPRHVDLLCLYQRTPCCVEESGHPWR